MNSPASADKAVLLSPSDPDAYYARALLLQHKGERNKTVEELERVVALRPLDYVFWYELALARDSVGDSTGAVAACEESVRLAPNYGRTHWLLGNLFFRARRIEEAFIELRRAASSNTELLPNLFDLAWGTYRGDARAVQDAVQPQTNATRIALAQFFAGKGKYDEAVALFNASGDASKNDRRKLLAQLLTAKRFKEAYGVWSGADTAKGANRGATENGIAAVTDGSFEGQINFDDPGFGWQPVRDAQGITPSTDTTEPHTGAHSLRFDFNGNPNPSTTLLSQLVIVEPRARYRLRFSYRAEEVVTGGPLQVVVSDASSKDSRTLSKSAALPLGRTKWQDYELEFTAGDETGAINIMLQRQACERAPCPIFGRIWLDDFLLEKLINDKRQ